MIKTSALILLTCLLLDSAVAVSDYKPYLHKTEIPNSPQLRLFGQYATNLFPGSASYAYSIEVPKGVNGLQPTLFVAYNSQGVRSRLGILGAGWSLNQDLIYRDVNSTPDDTSDDKYLLVLDNNLYELVYANGAYHTEVDYWFRIDNFSDYWVVTKQDGTQYRFGYNADAELPATRGYGLKWYLDTITDTHGNQLYYSYSQSPYSADKGAVYLTQIAYNSDQQRLITFTYEDSTRPDRRRVYEQGNEFEESRRLTDITVTVDEELVRRYHLTYTLLNEALSTLSSLSYVGSDNVSTLYTISFDYYLATPGYTNQTSWSSPTNFTDGTGADFGVRLLDLNHDGYMDVVKRKETNENKTWLNDKQGNWSESSTWPVPIDIVSSSGVDQGVRFEDVNRDGFTDVLVARAGTRAVYLNNYSGWNSTSWTLPADFVDSSGVDQGTQLADVNADGRPDIVKAKGGTRAVYLHNGSGWSTTSLSFPADLVDSSGVDQGTRLLDVNGDGWIDVLRSSNIGSSVRTAWLNNGSGWTESSTWTPPSSLYFTESSKPDTGVRFADANGDGLVDILEDFANGSTTSRGAWINTGNGWSQNTSWEPPEPFTRNGNNTGRRLADVNGDGYADILVSEGTSQYTWLKNVTTPYLLASVTSEYGGVTTINYTTSTQFDNTEDNVSKLGFAVYVVANATKNNSLSSDFNTVGAVSYNYSYGKYNYDKAEFRGFGLTTETMPTSVRKHYFYQDDARRAKEYQTEIYDTAGVLYAKTVKDFNYTLENGIYNLSLRSQTEYSYDGLATPVVRNASFDYNIYGNPQLVTDHGDVDVNGDERYTNYTYGLNTQDWIINKVSRQTVYDADFTKVRETKHYYDNRGLGGVGSLGELTKTEQWASDGDNTYTYFDYNSVGNLISKTDSLGNTYTYRYDDLDIFVESIINPLGHITTYSYDAGTGNLLYSEMNGIRTSYEYDTFGRVTKEIQPYDTDNLPTKQYSYGLDGTAPEEINISLRTTANNTQEFRYLYDGFANLVQLKQEVENGQDVVQNVFYDTEFKVGSVQNPYFATRADGLASKNTNVNQTKFTYDAMGRTTFVRNTDGTNRTTVFAQYNITDYDENGHRHLYELDAHGRISAVYEYNTDALGGAVTYTTRYVYDGNDNLIRIVDNEGNVFSFAYDSLSRKTGMVDPDMGNWTYTFDTNNNLIRQTDSRAKAITLTYDALNRVLAKQTNTKNITLTYDQDYYGTLSNVTRTGGSAVSVNFTYDNRLRVTNVTKNLSGFEVRSYILYDSQDRVISDDGIDMLYNLQGMVDVIPGYIDAASYNAFGSILNRTYDNGLVATYTYNTANNRLLNITIPTVQSLSYTYDSGGNILTIQDGVANKLTTLSYDDLDRLVNATIGSDRYVYSFNSIGNIMKIVKNNESKKFVYNGLAHAPSTIIDGAAGVDVADPQEITTNSKDRVYQFVLINDRNESTAANFTVSLGNGSVINSTQNITLSTAAVVLFEANYTRGGDYSVNVSVQANNSADRQLMDVKFGTRADSVNAVYTNISQKIFELITRSDITENIADVSWNCSNGLSSTYSFNFTSNTTVYVLIDYNYASAGNKELQCDVTSLDGNESTTLGFEIPALDIQEYDVLYTNTSNRVVQFDATNQYYVLETNVTTVTNGETASRLANISNGARLIVITETNYSSDGAKTHAVSLSATNISENYTESFTLQGVGIENYQRIENNFTNQILLFDVVNKWNDGVVNWTVVNPSVTNSTTLATDARVAVIIENSYTQQDRQKAQISAVRHVYTPRFTDLFEVHPLQLVSLQTLYESFPTAIAEIVARNNLNISQVFSWTYNTGSTDITSTNTTNITSDDVFVIISAAHNTGAQKTSGFINSTSYNDTENSVVVLR